MTENLYEKEENVGEKGMDLHRALTSLMEELEAVDYYNQRANTTRDENLKSILIHNRDEEKEHAAMLIEYIRRVDDKFDKELKEILFKEGDVTRFG
ncbi:MAG: ferritin [Caldiserica bacterium CG02_land_8_20_14_3_00_36_38]|nr:ferritin [Caldisericota bacterium]NCQ52923.1 ferritin [Caldisericota bacterium]OIP11818.1 MAG: ferritin [Caldisericum sp. CG2_30_36_11]PIV56606.1 MAG: ferritin [Caldiserica bacterium CG02_land_8_20_14_3_00_36_38]PIX29503.1 MAG: ferritin [Caldiserica bacterium CG_4_8_14_3_um_filter_35_18]